MNEEILRELAERVNAQYESDIATAKSVRDKELQAVELVFLWQSEIVTCDMCLYTSTCKFPVRKENKRCKSYRYRED